MQYLRYIRIALFAAALGLGCISLIYLQLKKESEVIVLDKPSQGHGKMGGAFTLIDQHGKTRTDEEFRGKYMLIYFGYSFCPDVCPLGMNNISEALKLLGRDLDSVVPIFITIDPERDTSENLKIYGSNFHPNFILLTGTQVQLDPVMKAYKVYAAKATPDGTMADYLMDHSTMIYLVDREGKFLEFFPHTTEPQKIAETLHQRLIQEMKEKSHHN
jgi:protein SCO1/2